MAKESEIQLSANRRRPEHVIWLNQAALPPPHRDFDNALCWLRAPTLLYPRLRRPLDQLAGDGDVRFTGSEP